MGDPRRWSSPGTWAPLHVDVGAASFRRLGFCGVVFLLVGPGEPLSSGGWLVTDFCKRWLLREKLVPRRAGGSTHLSTRTITLRLGSYPWWSMTALFLSHNAFSLDNYPVQKTRTVAPSACLAVHFNTELFLSSRSLKCAAKTSSAPGFLMLCFIRSASARGQSRNFVKHIIQRINVASRRVHKNRQLSHHLRFSDFFSKLTLTQPTEARACSCR